MITHTSTAGREVSHPHETNDCVVVALAHAMSIPYAEAHAYCERFGRRPKQGMRDFEIDAMLRVLEKEGKIAQLVITPVKSVRPSGYVLISGGYNRFARRPRRIGTTVVQFLRTLPKKGRFYLTCTSHAFAVVDGQLLDNLGKSKMRALMTSCRTIKLAEPTATEPGLTQSDISEMWARLDKIKF